MKKNNLNLNNSLWGLGILTIIIFTYLKFDPTPFLRVLLPTLLGSSFVLLGIFALPEVRKNIKKHYARSTKNILYDIKCLRSKQKNKDIEDQIKLDEDILFLRRSLKGSRRDYFERCLIYSAILFIIALLLTFLNLEQYLQISNLVIMIFFSFWGIFYFARMIQALFVALNIIKLD